MVLPLLLSMGLPALVGSGALGAGTFLAGLSAPALAGIGAGLGSFIETGDLGTGIRTGLTSFLGRGPADNWCRGPADNWSGQGAGWRWSDGFLEWYPWAKSVCH
jgi:hypothetical protein